MGSRRYFILADRSLSNSTSNVREGIVNNPMPGTWYVEARGTRGYVGRTGDIAAAGRTSRTG